MWKLLLASQSNWTSQRLVVLIARRNVMSWLVAKANVMKNGQMLSNQQLSPIFNTAHYDTVFENQQNCLIFNFTSKMRFFLFQIFEFSRQKWEILWWFLAQKYFFFYLSAVCFCLWCKSAVCLHLFSECQLFVYNIKKIVSCLFTL